MNAKSPSIALYGGFAGDHWNVLLAQSGYSVVVCDTLQTMLEYANRRWCTAVFLVQDHPSWDALEAVLNIRDMGIRVPIFVLGGPINPRIEDALAAKKGVHRCFSEKDLARHLNNRRAPLSPHVSNHWPPAQKRKNGS